MVLSIIIPAYNAADTIEKCVESVCLAFPDYHKVEILIVNDGSKDKTAEIVSGIIDRNKHIIRLLNQQNGGVSRARNLGLQNATGEWVIFVDADDELSVGTQETLFSLIDSTESDSLIMYSMKYIYPERVTNVEFPNTEISIRDILSKTKYDKIRGLALCSPCNKVYNSRIIKENQIQFSPDIKIGEDFIFNCRYNRSISTFKMISETLYQYNCNEKSAIGRFYPDSDAFIMAMDDEYSCLLKTKGYLTEEYLNIKSEFVADRWSYVLYMCLNSNIPIRKKIDYFKRYLSIIPEPEISVLQSKSDRFSKLYSKYHSGVGFKFKVVELVVNNALRHIKSKIYRLLKNRN